MFGLRRSAAGAGGAALSNEVISGLKSMASLSEQDLELAKALAKGNLFRNMDDDATMMHDISQQLMTTGEYCSPADLAALIDGVTVASATSAASGMLKSNPTVAAYGDNHALPHYNVVKSSLA